MSAPRPVPEQFRRGPFTTAAFRAAGLSPAMLEGRRFRRVQPRVWVWSEHRMSAADELEAARLALPDHARMSHRTRLQALGLDAPAKPFHFTVAGDLHLDLPGVTLHRTKVLPPCDGVGVHPASAWVQECASLTRLEAVALGDWLLFGEHADRETLVDSARLHPWRPGAREALQVVPDLDGRARSLPESHLRCRLMSAGLPRPEVNADVLVAWRRVAIADLLFREWGVAVEYEGRQHHSDAWQFARDVQRYADLRAGGIEYVQVTAEMMRSPRAVVLAVYQCLRRRGYDGPAPVFGHKWASWDERIRVGR